MPPEAPKAGGNYRFVSISNGEMKYRASRDAAEKTVIEKVEGYFKRTGIQYSKNGNKDIISVEVEIEDREGVTNLVQVAMENSVGSCMMAGFVLELAANDFVSLAASPSKEKNDFGNYTTFVNGQRYNYQLQKWEEIRVTKSDFGDGSWKDLQDGVMDKLEKHPAYKVRERGSSDDDNDSDSSSPSSFEVYAQTIESKKWPTPRDKDNQAAHLAWLGGLCDMESAFASFDDITAAQWKEINQAVGLVAPTKMPNVFKAL